MTLRRLAHTVIEPGSPELQSCPLLMTFVSQCLDNIIYSIETSTHCQILTFNTHDNMR